VYTSRLLPSFDEHAHHFRPSICASLVVHFYIAPTRICLGLRVVHEELAQVVRHLAIFPLQPNRLSSLFLQFILFLHLFQVRHVAVRHGDIGSSTFAIGWGHIGDLWAAW
jgi:hypothetical protein